MSVAAPPPGVVAADPGDAARPTVLHVRDHLQLGGAERMLASLVRELDRHDLARNVVCLGTGRAAHPALVAQLRAHAVRVRALGRRRLVDPRLTLGIAALGRSEGAALVHSHAGTTNGHARAAARLLGVPHVTTLHSAPGPLLEDAPRALAVDRATAALSAAIVAPSEAVAEAWARTAGFPRARLRVIANTPAETPSGDPGRRARTRRAEGLDADTPVVLCVARLTPAKGVADLVEAALVVRTAVSGVRVLVAGAGPERERLLEQVAARGLTGVVRLLGDRDDVARLLEAADVFCLPSHHEGLPVSLLEAMAFGLPCVTCPVGGVPELIEHERTGLLVAPQDPGALGDALVRVLNDDGLARRLGDDARRLVDRRHRPADAAAQYAALYRELLAAPTG